MGKVRFRSLTSDQLIRLQLQGYVLPCLLAETSLTEIDVLGLRLDLISPGIKIRASLLLVQLRADLRDLVDMATTKVEMGRVCVRVVRCVLATHDASDLRVLELVERRETTLEVVLLILRRSVGVHCLATIVPELILVLLMLVGEMRWSTAIAAICSIVMRVLLEI